MRSTITSKPLALHLVAAALAFGAFDRVAHAEPQPDPALSEPRARLLGAYLHGAAALDEHQRIRAGLGNIGIGALAVVLGSSLLEQDNTFDDVFGTSAVVVGSGAALVGLVLMLVTTGFEDLAETYDRRAPGALSSEDVAALEARARELVADRASGRTWTGVVAGVLGGALLIMGISEAASAEGQRHEAAAFIVGGSAIAGLGLYGLSCDQSTQEDLWDAYREAAGETTRVTLTPAIAPIDGGLVLGLGGAF